MNNCSKPTNDEIASLLERIADLLEAQDANPFRVRAYRRAAEVARCHRGTLAALADDIAALEELPNIGPSIARTVSEYVRSGHSAVLSRLEGEMSIEQQMCRIPGIGDRLAAQIHRELHIESLEDLEIAAHDGRLASLVGFGPTRVRAVINALDSQLSRRRYRQDMGSKRSLPPVALLLEVDEIYRLRAAANQLKMIAPRRFNPERDAWLPIMHLELEAWQFTVLYSNTALAHELRKTGDWVVIYYENEQVHGQVTVVDEPRGELEGKRVVRGREEECLAYYRRGTASGFQRAPRCAKFETIGAMPTPVAARSLPGNPAGSPR